MNYTGSNADVVQFAAEVIRLFQGGRFPSITIILRETSGVCSVYTATGMLSDAIEKIAQKYSLKRMPT